jgi:hypothetical protein
LARVSPQGVPQRAWYAPAGESDLPAMVGARNGARYAGGMLGYVATLAETTLISSGSGNALVVKFDAEGKPSWAEREQGIDTRGYSVAELSDGSVALAGSFQGKIEVDTVQPYPHRVTFGMTTLRSASPGVFLARYDACGNPLGVAALTHAGPQVQVLASPEGGALLLGQYRAEEGPFADFEEPAEAGLFIATWR